jgi:prepilin-type N-terminal cleavage/methylation domain-containing protein
MGPRLSPTSSARAGFTLFELLIVCSVISLIAAITIPKLLDTRKNAQESSARQTVKVIQHAQGLYQTKFGAYAGSMDELCTNGLLFGPFGTGKGTMQVKGGYEFGTCIPQDPAGLADPGAGKSRFRVCAQPTGGTQTQRIANGEKDFFLLETGFMYEDTAIPDAVLGNAFGVIQSHPDSEFGTTYPAVPD